MTLNLYKPSPSEPGTGLESILLGAVFTFGAGLFGFGLDSDAIHSPNEHFGIFNYLKGIETIPYFYQYFTELSK